MQLYIRHDSRHTTALCTVSVIYTYTRRDSCMFYGNYMYTAVYESMSNESVPPFALSRRDPALSSGTLYLGPSASSQRADA